MADSELQNLTEDTAPASGDIVCVVVDPAGTPLARKMTVDNLGILDGWVPDGGTWTYASASTFTVPTNLTARFGKGTELRLVQTSAKYFYVTSSSYGAPNTTVTVTGGTDFTLANAAITAPFYSYAECPQGFPDWFNYISTPVGYETSPTNVSHRFCIKGTTVFVHLSETTLGVSNLTTKTYTLPVAAKTVSNKTWSGVITASVDNNTNAFLGVWAIASAGTIVTCYKPSFLTWTNSGNCMVWGVSTVPYGTMLEYEM